MDRLEEGAEQIERSEATRGLVFFNMKNIINHESFWGKDQGDNFVFPGDAEAAQCALLVEAHKLHMTLLVTRLRKLHKG